MRPSPEEESIRDVVLHAFDWSFDTIRARAAEIADAGYGAVLFPLSGPYRCQLHQHVMELGGDTFTFAIPPRQAQLWLHEGG